MKTVEINEKLLKYNSGNFKVVQQLVNNANNNIADDSGESLLHWASFIGKFQSLYGILFSKSNKSSNDLLLHLGNENITDFLLKNGANFNLVDKYGRTSIYLAARYGN